MTTLTHTETQPRPYSYASARPTNGFAVASLILSIVWLGWLGSLLAIIFGIVALEQIEKSAQNGRGLAIAGVVLGWAAFAIPAALFIIGFFIGAVDSATGGY